MLLSPFGLWSKRQDTSIVASGPAIKLLGVAQGGGKPRPYFQVGRWLLLLRPFGLWSKRQDTSIVASGP
ncbi:MAG: hypothetical protein V4649_11330, partial [Bacteroidota bacterium]